MQSFRDSSAPPTTHPGFMGGVEVGGGASSYPPQQLGPQSSPRIPEEYVGVQSQQHIAPSQHPRPMMPLQTSQAAIMQGYGFTHRGGGGGEALPGDAKHGSGNSTNNHYRKEMMGYYFSANIKDGNRRGGQGLGYGTGFGFSKMDGQVPHQYRPVRTSGSASGMPRYQMDYGVGLASGSGNNSNSGSGSGAFSPSHQYSLGQNPAVQTAAGPQVHLRHRASSFSSHQTLHHGQQQRGYALPGHRFPPVSHYPPNAPTGPVGVYSSSPQRYSGRNGGSFDLSKMNNSSSVASSHNLSLANHNNTGHFDNVGQSYPSSEYLYNSQSSHPVHPHRHSQQNLGLGYDAHKTRPTNLVNQPGLPYPKHPSSSKSSSMNLSVSQFPSQEVSKSPMHSQTQQPQMHQNFSPISNPSPAASVVQSPSCSSSPSPLMGILEGQGSSAGPPALPQSHPPIQKPRSSHGNNRLLQMMNQLSPTPSSNSSSGCGSSGNVSTASLNTNPSNSHSQTCVGVGMKGVVSEEHSSSFYPSSPHDTQILDPGTDSLNALSSQVANLPDTVQRSDFVLSEKRSKDSRRQIQMQQSMHALATDQQRNRYVSASCSTATQKESSRRMDSGGTNSDSRTDEETSQMLESPNEGSGDGEELSETQTEKVISLRETESPGRCPPSQNQMKRVEVKSQKDGGCQGSPVNVEIGASKRQTKTLNSANAFTSEKGDHTDDCLAPSSSLSSCISPSVEHGKFLCPSRPSSSSFSVSPTPSPTSISLTKSSVSPVQTNHAPEESECGQLRNRNEQEGEDGYKTGVGEQKSDIRQGQENDKEIGQCMQNEKDGRHIEKCTKEKESEKENQIDLESSDEPGITVNSKETHAAGGVGVIVSTRSENTQPEAISEQSSTVVSELTHKSDRPNKPGSYNSKQHAASQISFAESSNHNGESRENMMTNPSPHGTKVSHESSVEAWVASHAHSDFQKSSLGYSKFPHSSGTKSIGRPMLSEGGIGTSFRYQGYSQPQHHYSPNLRKNLDIEGRGRNNLGSETEKGQNANKQLQQPFPSLLQEVLQGYHTDKRYGQNERSAQQFQTSNTHDYSHYRYPQSVMDHTRPHVMTSHSRMAMNHHMQPQTSAYEKQYPPKERHESEVCIGQDPSVDSWSVIGAGTKRAQWSTVDKSKMVTSPSHSTSTMQQSADLSVLPHSKQINLTEHSIPSRKLSSNHPATSSAVQQLLLQDTEQTGHSGVTVGLPQNASLSERRSVICDVSPSHPPTPEKLFDGDKGERCNCESQSECHGASVIQQSVTSATVDKESTSSGQDVKTDMKREEKQLDIKKAHHLETSHCNDSPAQENTSKNENTSLPPLDLKPSKDGILNYDKSSPYQPQRPQHSFSNPNTHSSRLHSYFEGTAESNHSVMSVGHGCEEAREGTNRSQNPHHLSQHHDFSSLSQAQNPESTDKLQMYPQSSSLRYSHHLDGWATPNNNQPSSKDLTGSSQQQNRLEGRIQAGMLAPQQQLPQISPHGNYYEKMWGLSSEKEKEGKMGVETFQRQQQTPPAVLPESVANPQIPPSESKLFEQNSSRIISQDIAKSFHRVSDNGDSSGNTVNKTAHGKTRTGGSGETNPLMMRRRVRSFISPIPAKRQHQDVFQQQRGTPSQHSNIASNAVPKHRLTSDPSSPNTAHLNLANQKIHSTTPPQSDSIISPSSSLAKTKILPPRKGRGLKLEAIVQKITPSLKKAANTSSDINMDSASNQLSLTAVAPYSPDTHDQDSADGGNFIRTGAETGSCLPYLSEGLSLDDIMSYRGVEETGPPPPTAYPCDPNQDPHILKCDMMGNMTMGVVRDLEPELDFGLGVSGRPKLDNDCTGERDKDDLQMPPDFSLLGPLPPPPPLPCPVQASPPPSSSGLADIQNFTATYQQLEPRRGEHTAATLLREKLQEGGLVMRMDNYVGRDFFSAKTSHNNQSLGHCLLTSPQRTRLPHHPHHSSAGNLLVGSQFAEAKLENSVPKGYFPSGKKRGRPVGSVNKQKRIQSQPQNLSISALPDSQTSTAAPVAPTPVDTQSTDTINVIHADSPETEKVPTASVSLSNTPQTGKEVVEAEETKPEINVKPRRQRRGKTEESQGGLEQRRRRRGVVGLLAKEDMENAGAGEVSGGAICHGYKKSVFAPYIHVERKLEIGNVCTVVNGDDSGCRWSGKEVGGWASAPLNSTLSSSLVKGDREMDHIKEKRMFENVDTAPVQSSLPGKALPSSGYVLSGAVMTDSSTCGHLLCCLCKKWANYKDLGDLYGPYYPPDYSTKLSKNPPVTRQQGTGKLRSTEANLRTAAAESTNQDSPVAEIQTHASQISKNSAEDQATDLPIDTTVTDTSLIGALDMQCDTDNNGNKDNLLNYLDSVSKLNTMAMDFKPLGELNNLEGQLQSQTVQTEDTQKRPQHRKLTSHPRFKRRHKSNEDLHKSGRTNNKALLPFQPPPPLQLLKQGASDLSAALSMLPQVPLDPEELWVHEGCIVWASGVFLVNGRLYGLQETLDGARDMCCSYCEMVGSTLGCYSKGCTLRYHYLCAIEADCSLNEDNFSLRCPKHKVD